MDLLERYLQAVRKYLPWTLSRARQDDIVAELRANYESQLEEREADLDRKLTEGEMIDWLKQLGNPMQVAGRYQPVQYLIGPTLFPMYLYVLRLALIWSLAIYAFVTIVLTWTGVPIVSSVAEAIFRAPGVMFTAATWVTLVFVVLEYIFARHPQLLPRMDGINVDWSPSKLAPLEPARSSRRKQPVFAKFAAQVIFEWLFLGWLLLVPKYPFLMFGPSAWYAQVGPFKIASVWWTFYWVVVAFNFAQIVWNTMDLTSGAWRRPTPLKPLFFKAGGLITIGVLLTAQNHVFALLKDPAASDAAKYNAMLNQLNPSLYFGMQVVFLIVAMQFAWEIYQLFLDSRSGARS
ncbi:HAAS signaling domain-containing protein [Terracidiphilus gabretensis]|uniref:HAAS signaling domain-containing protein n=1 Tax=Terracidiphilus gabretensis TaxID=1577687 RepID=UPI00071B35E2|nr:hypothetical protein [Terracidiphilus gabretensis]